MDGHVHAFAFFARVPQSVLYDNDRCSPLGHASMPCRSRDGTRKRATLFSALQSHYLFRDRYGRPGLAKLPVLPLQLLDARLLFTAHTCAAANVAFGRLAPNP